MKIGIIGATGKAGRAIYTEAVRRGHETTALVRDPGRARELFGADVDVVERDAFDLRRDDLSVFDAVVDAFSAPAAQAYRHIDLATRLVALLRETTTPRLLFILGAGSLRTGSDRHLFVEDLRKAPGADAWVATPEAQLKELRFLEGVDDVAWVGVSPSRDFAPGEARTPVLGGDELLIAADGSSQTSTGTMAVAILDELEQPRHHRERFTVRDA